MRISEKHKIFLCQEGEKCGEIPKGNFRKSQKLLTEQALSEFHGDSLFRTFNSYSFSYNRGLRKCHTSFCLLRTPSPRGEQFLRFFKIDLLPFHLIYLLFDWSKLSFFFYMCLLRTNLPNLCPNMIHVDALDLSECHSEEVISFFWCSVYVSILESKLKFWRSLMFIIHVEVVFINLIFFFASIFCTKDVSCSYS